MGLEELQKAFAIIEVNRHDAHFDGGIDEALIHKAELRLGFEFPATYRSFLKTYGCGCIRGIEIYGPVKDDFDNSGIPDAVWITLKKRKENDLPGTFLIFHNADDWGYFAINTAVKNAEGESPVVAWIPERDTPESGIIARDFGDFLYDELKNTFDSL